MRNRLVPSLCPYCGTGCGVLYQVLDGRLAATLPNRASPVNRGGLCIKGWNAHEHALSPDRLATPLVREGGDFLPCSWDRAVSLAASRLADVLAAHGPDSIGFLASAKATNEENYLAQKFARAVIGTNNVDHCARLCHSSTVAGLAGALGSGAMTNSLEDLEQAACIFVIGSNTTECHPLVSRRIMRAKARGARLLVADPRHIQLSGLADLAVRHRPGSDVALLNGMMRVILDRGFEAREYIESRTEGFEELRAVLAEYPLERAEELTGVPAARIAEMAEMYATNRPAALCYAMGITQHSNGVDKVRSCCNLALLTGSIGIEGGGINPLRGQNNVQGACDMGALPDVYPGYQKVADPAVREKFSRAWGRPLPETPGLTLTEMIPAILAGRIKALWVMGENPALSDPDCGHVQEALSRLEFLGVQDLYLTQTARLAHLVLPAAAAPEKDGTFTNTERRCALLRPAVPPPGEALPDWDILCRLARAMGRDWSYAGTAEIFAEMATLTPSYAGMSHARLGLSGLQWPCPTPDHPGTPVLHRETFARGRARFFPVGHAPAAEVPDQDYPLVLTTGRMYAQYHTATMSGRSAHLNAEAPAAYAEMHPRDAGERGLADGDLARLATRRGSVTARVRVTPRVSPGLVFMPFHFPDGPANRLTNPALDPVCRIPEFKACAVRVEKSPGPDQGG